MAEDPNQAAELERLHAAVFEAQTQGLHGALTLLTMMVLTAATMYPPAFMTVVALTGAGCLEVIRRGVRRRRAVRAFCRDARLVEARVIAPPSSCAWCSTRWCGHEEREHAHAAGWYLKLAIPDAERMVVARVRRRWPRIAVDMTRVPTWYAPGSSIVVCFDRNGEPMIGRTITEPLPRAALAQR